VRTPQQKQNLNHKLPGGGESIMAEPSVTALLQERASRVVDYIIEHLALIGVEHVFGVDGANIEDLYDAAHFCGDITAVLAKHEFSAAAMADRYSRGLAGLGVVAATSGGGFFARVAALPVQRANCYAYATDRL
jgi:acetolactate synthase I/II/III large subunit